MANTGLQQGLAAAFGRATGAAVTAASCVDNGEASEGA